MKLKVPHDMANLFVDFSLELRHPTASTRRGQDDSRIYIYFSDVNLHGTKMTAVVPVSVGKDETTAPYKDRTSAQVIGGADVVGDTFFLNDATVFASDRSTRRDPFVVFRASVNSFWGPELKATIPGGSSWPPPTDVRGFCDLTSEHLLPFEDEELAPSTVIDVSGNLLNREDGVFLVDVHDIGVNGRAPCHGNSVGDPAILSESQQQALCRWLEIYYPAAGKADGREEAATAEATMPADDASECAGPSPVAEAAVSGEEHTHAPLISACAENAIRQAVATALADRDNAYLGRPRVVSTARIFTPTESLLNESLAGATEAGANSEAGPTIANDIIVAVPSSTDEIALASTVDRNVALPTVADGIVGADEVDEVDVLGGLDVVAREELTKRFGRVVSSPF